MNKRPVLGVHIIAVFAGDCFILYTFSLLAETAALRAFKRSTAFIAEVTANIYASSIAMLGSSNRYGTGINLQNSLSMLTSAPKVKK